MTAITPTDLPAASLRPVQPGLLSRFFKFARTETRTFIGGLILLVIAGLCVVTLPWTLSPRGPLSFEFRNRGDERLPPSVEKFNYVMGTDAVGRSVLARSLLGGSISLAVGFAAAAISVTLGVTVGLIAGYRGGWIDSFLMRVVDILYGLPYIVLVLLFKIALEDPLKTVFAPRVASLIVMFLAIGLVSWLTMARVIRGQVLSIRSQPYIEACRAVGLPERRIFLRHLLPNLIGPITVYATLTIPQAILSESFLSFLGIGIDPTLPTWGALAAENRSNGLDVNYPEWWMILFPCLLLSATLLSLNFLGDGLRDRFDPKKEAAKL